MPLPLPRVRGWVQGGWRYVGRPFPCAPGRRRGGAPATPPPRPRSHPLPSRLLVPVTLPTFFSSLQGATLCLAPTGAAAQAPPAPGGSPADLATVELTRRKAKILVDVAFAARRVLTDESRCDADRSCSCSQSSCAKAMPDTLTCTDRLGPEGRACQDLPGQPGTCTARRLDFKNAYVHVAPGLLNAAGRTTEANLAEDICFTKALNPVFERFAGNGTGPWTYFASASGMIRLYPGSALQSGDDYTQCATYDPRLRPWYVVGSGGLKDFVILVDASRSMRQPLEKGEGNANATRSNEAFRFVTELMNTFQDNDAVGVVVYGLDTPSGVEVLSAGDKPGMSFAKQAAQREMLNRLETLNTSMALANPDKALDTAFDLLNNELRPNGQTANCTRVIFMLSGSPAGATQCEDACAKAPPSQPCTCKEDVLARVTTRQEALANATGRGALVATVTLGDTADDSLLRQTSCLPLSQGVWTHVAAANENIITTLNPFYRLLSSSQWSPDPPKVENAVASELYDDAGGFGRMTSLTLPIYGTNRALLGLVGTDITLRELKEAAGDSLAVVQRSLNQRAPKCRTDFKEKKPLVLSGCEVQEARGADFCPALADVQRRAWEKARYDCWQGGRNTVYVPYPTKSSRAEADAWCRLRHPGGTLAIIEDATDNGLVSSLLGEDGTWLGVTRPEGSTGTTSWVNDRPTGAGNGSPGGAAFRSWAREQPASEQDLTCVAADRRGGKDNWFASDCIRPRHVLCSFPLAQLPNVTLCSGTTLKLLERPKEVPNVPNESNPGPGVTSLQCKEETGNPVDAPRCESLTSEPLCPIGSVDNACNNFCCPGCSCRFDVTAGPPGDGDGLSVGEIIGIVAGVAVGLLVVAGLALVALSRRRGQVELPLPLPLDDDGGMHFDDFHLDGK